MIVRLSPPDASPPAIQPEGTTRRALLTCGACALAVACAGEIPSATGADTDALPATPAPTPPPPTDALCASPEPDAQGWVPLDQAAQDALTEVLGFAYVTLAGAPVVVARVEEDCFIAMARPCSHEGELIEYRPERNGFVCPRHGAIYAWDGDVLGGPAPLALETYPCGPLDGVVHVRLPGSDA